MKVILFSAAVSVFATACTSTGPKSAPKATESPTFDHLKTYSWLPSEQMDIQDQALSEDERQALRKQVQAAIRKDLQSKGYSEADTNPDFLIGYHIGFEAKTALKEFNSSIARSGDFWHENIEAAQVEERGFGFLVIDFIASEEKELFFRATGAVESGERKGRDERQPGLNDAVAKLLARFPEGR